MTGYNGERRTICHTATADGVAMVPADCAGVFVTVYSRDFTEIVLAEVLMVWNTTKLRWEYVWDTTEVDAGTYQARVRILGVDGLSNWEYFRLKLTLDRVPVSA